MEVSVSGSVIDVIPEQPLNAQSPSVSNEFDNFTFVILVQFEYAPLNKDVIVFGSSIFSNDLHPEKALASITFNPVGKAISFKFSFS